MAFLLRSRLFGFLLILAALPVLPAAAALAADADVPEAEVLSVEARLRRIAGAVLERDGGLAEEQEAEASSPSNDLLAAVFVNGPRVGFNNGGFRNGGFWNGGFRNGGGWRNGGFGNGGFRNGGGFRNFW
jgi:rSAM-associated Gly-rich repeat protein